MLLTIIAVIMAFLIAVSAVYFQYFYRERKSLNKRTLAFLRFLSIFALLILIINPKIRTKTLELIKPKLLVAVDNSLSVSLINQDSIVGLLVEEFNVNQELLDQFEIEKYTFGSSLKSGSNYSFDESKTNIREALSGLNELAGQRISPIILVTDGNQTYGNDYKYYKSNQHIYPLIIGDTIISADIEISKINVNSYSFLQNNFPVEVFIRYNGDEIVNSNFIIEESGKIVYKQNLSFSKRNNSIHLQFNLTANKIGKHLYKSKIEPFDQEKNTFNNYKNFAIDIIDEQTNIAIIYDVLHPDIGMLKRSVETNKQRKVSLYSAKDFNNNSDIDAFILYQPNQKFQSIFKFLANSDKNYLIVTGTQTDYDFLNNVQSNFNYNALTHIENYYAKFNLNFTDFFVDDIGFSEFPPLDNLFGEVQFLSSFQTILFQSLNGISTEDPVLATFIDDDKRGIVLFGENIWKWRLLNYKSEQSFQNFDQFINSLIQYITISSANNPLEINYKPFYYTDEPIQITAKLYDKNFNFDNNANLEIIFEEEKKRYPFYFKNNQYEVTLNDLEGGDHHFIVKNKGTNTKGKGIITVVDYSIEQEKSNANVSDLNILANNSKGKTYYPDQINNLITYLLKNKEYVSLQKERIKRVSLIDWKWLLYIIIVSLSLEWFMRKFRGMT